LAWQELWPQRLKFRPLGSSRLSFNQTTSFIEKSRSRQGAGIYFRIFRLDSGPYNDVLGYVSDPP
jgi:hypothetical protein